MRTRTRPTDQRQSLGKNYLPPDTVGVLGACIHPRSRVAREVLMSPYYLCGSSSPWWASSGGNVIVFLLAFSIIWLVPGAQG